MREIKFRAWRKEHQYPIDPDDLDSWEVAQMCYGAEGVYDGGVDGLGGVGSFGYLITDERYTLMQYTGLKDKNGVEIYEGDIVRATYIHKGQPEVMTVKWNEDWMCWDFDPYNSWDIEKENAEVIGNVYENPELL